MKNIILITMFGLMVSFAAQAQNGKTNKDSLNYSEPNNAPLRISIGIEQGVPTSLVAKNASYVMGASVQAEYMMLKELGITLNIGCVYFMAKNGGTGLPMLPLMGGARFHITPKLYLSGQMGTSFYLGKENTIREKSMYFTYAQGIGYQVLKRIDVLAKYEGINVGVSKTYSFVGMRVAYTLDRAK